MSSDKTLEDIEAEIDAELNTLAEMYYPCSICGKDILETNSRCRPDKCGATLPKGHAKYEDQVTVKPSSIGTPVKRKPTMPKGWHKTDERIIKHPDGEIRIPNIRFYPKSLNNKEVGIMHTGKIPTSMFKKLWEYIKK